MIYLDHAATTPLDKQILDKMLPYLTTEFGNADSPHALGRKAMCAVDSARDTVAALINAKPSEVYFTSGGTEADNWAMHSGAYAAREKGKDHILVSAIEHHAVLEAAKKLEREGFSVTYLPVNAGGRVELSALESALTERTGLIAVMAVNNETGVIQPVKEIAQIAQKNGCLFFCDGVQAAPYMPIDVKEWGVDMLSFSSHKFYGPKGCGVLYIKGGVRTKGLIVGGEQERGLRGGTTNVPCVVGMAAAYAKNVATMSEANARIRRLREVFIDDICYLGGLHINGDGDRIPGVLNLRIEGIKNADFVYRMDLEGVCVAAGSACASASIKPSHVLLAMGMTDAEAKESVRISFGKENTEQEVHEAVTRMVRTVNALRGKSAK